MEKRTITRFMAIFLMVMMAFGAFSQQLVPDFFNYQAIVRDSDGNIVADQAVTVRMTFMDDATVVTTEDYMVSTNDYGLITLAADLLPAEFIGTYYADPSIKIEIDFGSGFVNLGETDLASVPYAMQAGNVATLNGNELTVGTGSTVTIPDAALVGQNATDIVTLQGQVLTIESTITLMGTTVADHTTRIEALENAGFITSESDPVFAASAAANINQVFINNWNMAYGWGNHATAGYLTSYTETDPLFGISIAAAITGSDVTNWNMAYGWGDHSQAGYLTSFTESDPIFGVSTAASITGSDVTNWNAAFGWGDHSQAGYLTSFTELDPVFGVSVAAAITGSDVTNWDAAFGWGDHSQVGYLTSFTETDPIWTAEKGDYYTASDVEDLPVSTFDNDAGYITGFTETDPIWTADKVDYYTASDVEDLPVSTFDNDAGYLTAETDPVFVASTAYGITDSDVDNWDEAFGWGDHQPAITALQSELDATQNGAGLNLNGTYTAPAGTNYISTAFSLSNADVLLENAISSVNNQVNINTNDILQNAGGISANAAAIATNIVNIAQNASDIDDNEIAIATNAANIATNASDIATNAAGIAANAAQIATNVVNIATNASGIASNFVLIGANQLAIAQNASDIASNAVNIAQNASDISSTQAELDVTQVGAGLNPDGTYPGGPVKSFNYISTASSLYHADQLLDAQVKINEDNIAGNLLLIMDNTNNISSNASDISSNYNLINDNSHWIFDEDQDTYITVEETADEDKIHIYQNGNEVLRIPKKGVLEMLGKSLAIGEGSGINQVNAEGKNTFVGSYAGHNTTVGINNLFIGNSAGKANTTGSNNLYIGNEAGLLNAAGSENTFIGAASGRASQLNSGNTFIGARSGFSSDEGSNNTYIGINAGYNSDEGSSNVLIGANVGYELTSGEANTYIGNLAGYNSTTGYRNAYVGFQAGYYNSTGSHNTFLGNEAGYWETGSDKLYIANDRGGNLANGREVALIYGEFDNDILHLNAITTVTNTLQAGESPDHSIGDAAFIVDGGAYIYRNFYVNEQTFLDQTTIDVNDGEFLIHDGEGYPSASTNGIMADVNGYIGLVSSVNSGNAQTGIQTIDEDNRPTAAISLNAVVGGVDIQAGDDIAIDAQTVYINGVDAAKGSEMAVGIGTDDTDGNIHIGHDTGDRIINIGLEDEGSAYTDEVNIEAEEINTFSENNTNIYAGDDVDIHAEEQVLVTAEATDNAVQGTGGADASIQFTTGAGGLDMNVGLDIAMDATNIYGAATESISLDAVTTSNFTVSAGDLLLETSSADIYVDANDQVFITGDNATDATIGTTQTGAIQLTAVNGGLDVSAGLDVTVDAANTIYLNGGAAAKAAGLAVGIATDDTNGDVEIAFDEGVRDVRIGQYEAAGGYTNQIILGSNTLNSHTYGNTTILADADIDMDASHDVLITAASDVDIDGTNIYGDANGGAISFDADAASNFNTSAGNLSFDAEDANVIVDGHTGVYVDATGTTAPVEINATGVINIGNDDVDQNINMGTAGERTINIGNDGATLVDVNATDIYLDAGNNVDIDAADDVFIDADDVVSIDAVNTSNFTVSTGDLDLITTVGTVDIDAGDNVEITAASDVVIVGTNITADASDQISLDAVNTSNFTVSTGDLQLYTGTADVDIDAADQFLVDADGTQDAAAGTGTLAAIQLTSAGGIDLEAADDVAIDGNTVYINGVDVAKGTNMAIGIGTDDTDGNIQIGYDQGARNINIGQYEAAGGYTSAITIGGNTLTSHTYSNTDIETEANMILDAAVDIDMDAGHDLLITVASDVDIDGTNILADASDQISLDAVNTSNFTVSTGNLELFTTTADVHVQAGHDVAIGAASDVDIAAVNISGYATGSIDLDADAASSFIVDGADLTLATIGTGGSTILSATGTDNATIGTTPGGAVQITASNGGVDINANLNVAIDGTAVYINGSAAKGTSTAVGIGTTSTSGNIEIGTAGDRVIAIGSSVADVLGMDAEVVEIDAETSMDLVSNGTLTMSSAEAMALNSSKGFTLYGAESSSIGSGINLNVDANTNLNLGTVEADAINIGQSGIPTNIDGTLDVDENVTLGANLDVDGLTTLDITTIDVTGGLFTVSGTGAMDVNVPTDVSGILTVSNATGSTGYGNGALIVAGGAGIGENLYVNGALDVNGATTLDRTTINTSDGQFTVGGTGTTFIEPDGAAFFRSRTNTVYIGDGTTSAITIGTSTNWTSFNGNVDVQGITNLDRTNIVTDDGVFSVSGSNGISFTVTGDVAMTPTGSVNINPTVGTNIGTSAGAIEIGRNGMTTSVNGSMTIDQNLTVTGTVQGGTITDGTASLNAGALSGLTSVSASGNITTTAGYFNGPLGASGDRDAAYVTSLSATGNITAAGSDGNTLVLGPTGGYYWRMLINASGHLEFQYSTTGAAGSWTTGQTFTHP